MPVVIRRLRDIGPRVSYITHDHQVSAVMTKLLYVKASPRSDESKSTLIADTYLAVLRKANPALEVDVLDVWKAEIPDFDGDKVAAKMNVILGQPQGGEQKTAWDQVVEVAGRFAAADRYLFSVPMWNLGIPYRLKQYIDVIHQPGILWGLDPQKGYFGLLQNKHATLALTAGAFGPGLPSPAFGVDYQFTYLRDWLNQAGITQIDEIRFQPSLLTADPEGDLDRAKERAESLARGHGTLAPPA